MAENLRIGAYQANGQRDGALDVVAEIEAVVNQAAELGVGVLCFPECYLTGYYTEPREAVAHAIRLSSPQMDCVLDSLKPFAVTVILGFLEKVEGGVFNSAAIVTGADVVGVYRKQRPNENGFLAGDWSGVFDAAGVRFSVNICNDANFPDLAARLASDGAQLIAYPLNNMLRRQTADRWRDRHLKNLRLRAQETSCWVVSADVVGETSRSIGYGCTAVVSPRGEVCAHVAELQEGLLVSEISPLATESRSGSSVV